MTRLAALLVAALAVPLSGCPKDQTGCTRTVAAAAGPGDERLLFPAGIGDLWAYRVDDAGTAYRVRVEASGPASAGGRAGVRLTEIGMGPLAPAGSTATVAVEPGGVTVLESAELEGLAPGLSALVGPRLLLRFPVTAGDTFTSLDCQGLVAGSLDGDGRDDPIDLRAVVTVVGEAPVATPDYAGPAVLVETRLDVAVRSSAVGAVSFTSRQQDWYAPGLGLVRSSEVASATGLPDATTVRTLYAWQLGAERHEPVTSPIPLAAGAVVAGEVARDGWQSYRVTAPAGAPLVIGLLAQSGPLGLGGGGPVGQGLTCGQPQPPTTGAVQCLVTAGEEVLVDVDGGGLTGASATYAVLAAPRPSVAVPDTESVTFARGEVVVGQVSTRGASSYTVTGLTPGVPVEVALFRVSGQAELRPGLGVPPDQFDPTCWLASSQDESRQCLLTATDVTGSFRVEAGSLDRDGASYLLAAW